MCDKCQNQADELLSVATPQGSNINICEPCIFSHIKELSTISKGFHLLDLENKVLKAEIENLKLLNDSLMQEFETAQLQQLDEQVAPVTAVN